MHTSLDGSPPHDVYAPCSTADLLASGFRYWALGHIHKRSTTEGPCAVVMPGIPQGRDVGEHGPKSVTLASVLDDGSITMEERIVSLAQFERVAVDASGVASWSDLAARLEKALGEAAGRSASDHLVARLAVSGATSMAWNIRRDADLLRTEAEARAEAIGNRALTRLARVREHDRAGAAGERGDRGLVGDDRDVVEPPGAASSASRMSATIARARRCRCATVRASPSRRLRELEALDGENRDRAANRRAHRRSEAATWSVNAASSRRACALAIETSPAPANSTVDRT